MGVEVDERQRAVPGSVGAELGERDRVVAAEHDREHAGVDERAEALLGQLVRADRVAGRELEVAGVDSREVGEDVDVLLGVVRAKERRGRPDRLGAEAGAGAEARGGVEREADDGEVDVLHVGHVREAHEGADPREARAPERVGGLVAAAHGAPPFTDTIWPVIVPAASLQKWAITSATSAGRPTRPMGTSWA